MPRFTNPVMLPLQQDPGSVPSGYAAIFVGSDGQAYIKRGTDVAVLGSGTGGGGGGGTTPLLFNQQTASAHWVISHTFTYRPSVSVQDNAGEEIYADVSFPDSTTVVVDFASATTGYAELR